MDSLTRLLFVAFVVATASPAFAQTVPYSFEADSFSIPERGTFDDFDDGSIGPAWNGTLFGTAVESGSTLQFSNPGTFGFLPAPLVNEVSVVSGQGLQLDFGGSFTATTVWSQATPDPGTNFSFAIGSIHPGTGDVHQFSISFADTLPGVQAELGGASGLGMSTLSVVRTGAPQGPIASLSRQSFGVLPGDVTGDVHLALAFDDVANTLQALYSVDGGTTVQPAGAPIPWSFSGGGFSLSAGSVVPEPGSALLIGLGLIGLSRHTRREA